MTTLKVKCKECGYEGEYNSEIYDGLCQECAERKTKHHKKDNHK